MRLWHYKLIKYLDNQRLLGQHRECCALRGKGWGKKHSVVDYVFDNSYSKLYYYHLQIMLEMQERGINVTATWFNLYYRGKSLGVTEELPNTQDNEFINTHYTEHNNEYYNTCVELLKTKDPNYYKNLF